MDEKKLRDMFGDAVPEAPPPSFSLGDIKAESGAQRARHRNLLLGGSGLTIAVIAGATVLGVALWKGTDAQHTAGSAGAPMVDASSGNSGNRPSDVPDKDQSPRAQSGPELNSVPPEQPKQGGPPTGNAGPPGPGGTLQGCGQADRELAAALAGELPAAASNLSDARAVCPNGSRSFAVQVSENGRTGVITVVLTPPGTNVDFPVTGSPQGTVVGTGLLKDGRRLFVITEPAEGQPAAPKDGDVQGIADRGAAKISG